MFGKRKTKLYFAPHQDDELLSMGVDICASLDKGEDVHVILCTDGSQSNVRLRLNNGQKCPKHPGLHQYALTLEEFTQARDREFTDSCLALGVDPRNIHILPQRVVDGSLTADRAARIIRDFLKEYGDDVQICTLSPTNGPAEHRDHRALGIAADDLLRKGVVREAKFFVEPYLYEKIRENPRLIPIAPTVKKATGSAVSRIKKAIDAYCYWNPQEQRYAVGKHSVSVEFDDFISNPMNCYFVKQTPNGMTGRDKLAFQYKKWKKVTNQKQLYYSMDTCSMPDLQDMKLVTFQKGDVEGYRNFIAARDMKENPKNIQRLLDGASFWCLTQSDGTMVSTGWLAYRQHFYIGETDFGFDMDRSDAGILFDFQTLPEYRGQGYYPMLLKSIVSQAQEPKTFVIYTSPDNTSSARGITKAGFDFDGTFSARDRSMHRYLRNRGFTNMTRKYQLWGLRVQD